MRVLVLLVFFLINASEYTVSAQTVIRGANTKFPYYLIGIEERIDDNVDYELICKVLNTRLYSFGIKISQYEYDENIPPLKVQTNFSSVNVSHGYYIRGFAAKAGWIFHSHIDRFWIFNQGIYLVGARSRHEYSRRYKDISGVSVITYSETDYTFGSEYECYSALRLFRHFILSASAQAGYKQGAKEMFKELSQGMNAYRAYSPAQGYGKYPVYINCSLGISLMF